MIKLTISLTALGLAISGCAHSTMRGNVAMKTGTNEAHVCLGEGEVKPGDKITAYKNVCPARGPKSASDGICRMEKLGEGTVTKLLNDHYSVVEFGPGVAFEEGTLVEKVR